MTLTLKFSLIIDATGFGVPYNLPELEPHQLYHIKLTTQLTYAASFSSGFYINATVTQTSVVPFEDGSEVPISPFQIFKTPSFPIGNYDPVNGVPEFNRTVEFEVRGGAFKRPLSIQFDASASVGTQNFKFDIEMTNV